MVPNVRIIPASKYEQYARVGWRSVVRFDPYAPTSDSVLEHAIEAYGPENVAISDDAAGGMVTLYAWTNYEH